MSEIQCWLQHLDGSVVALPPSGAMLGQASLCVFRLLDNRIAERHARIEVRDGSAFISPRDGAPCSLNGERLLHPRVLRDRDWISMAPGRLIRVCIRTRVAPRWRVELSGQQVWVSAEARATEEGMLRLSPEGHLLLRLRQPARRGGQILGGDGRAWALAVGDVIHLSDGQELVVLEGPAQSCPPPVPLAPGGRVRHLPPQRARLSPGGQLALYYPDERLSVAMGKSAAFVRVLLTQPGVPVPLEDFGGPVALDRLRTQLVAAGIDGFSLVSSADGGTAAVLAPIAEVELGVAVEPAATPEGARWWVCSDDGGRRLVDSAGVLIGRHEECEVRCLVPYVQRHHALIQAQCVHLSLTPLGRHPVYLDGNAVHSVRELGDGVDLRVVPEARLWIEQRVVPLRPASPYTLRLPSGALRTIRQGYINIGDILDDAVGACVVRLPQGLYLLASRDGFQHNGQSVRPRQPITLSVGDRLLVGSMPLEVVAIAPPLRPPRLLQIATQSFARQGRLLVRTDDGAMRRVGLRGLLFQLLLLLLEAAVGSRLRGVIQTRPSSDDFDDELEHLPRGAMRLQDIRLELVADRRLSLTATRALIAELQATLICGGLDGCGLIRLSKRWVCFEIDLDCTVDLYR